MNLIVRLALKHLKKMGRDRLALELERALAKGRNRPDYARKVDHWASAAEEYAAALRARDLRRAAARLADQVLEMDLL